jgi:hypothetical protein
VAKTLGRIADRGSRAFVQSTARSTVIANLARVDELAASGALTSLLASGAKLTECCSSTRSPRRLGDGPVTGYLGTRAY